MSADELIELTLTNARYGAAGEVALLRHVDLHSGGDGLPVLNFAV